jgi:hypothetical protein
LLATEQAAPDHKCVRAVAGIPGEVFIQAPLRRLFSYLIRPMEDQVMPTFRDLETTCLSDRRFGAFN